MVLTRKRKYEEDQLVEKGKLSKKLILNSSNSKNIKNFRSNQLALKSDLLDTQRKSKKLISLNGVKQYKKRNGKIITIALNKETKFDYESSDDSGIFSEKSFNLSNDMISSNCLNCDEHEYQESIVNKQHDCKRIWLENNLKPLKVVVFKLEDVVKNNTDHNSYPCKNKSYKPAKADLLIHESPLPTTDSHNEIVDVGVGKKLSTCTIKKSSIKAMHKKSKNLKVTKDKNSKAKKSSSKSKIQNLSVVTRKRSLKVIDKVESSKVTKLENSNHIHEEKKSDITNLTKIWKDSNEMKFFNSIDKLQSSKANFTFKKSSDVVESKPVSKGPGINKNSKKAHKFKLSNSVKTKELNNLNELESLKLDEISKVPETASKLKTSSFVNKLEENDGNDTNHSKVLNLLYEFENKDFIMQGSSAINDCKDLNISNESNSSDSEWEEVTEEVDKNLEDYKPDILHEGVQITIAYKDRKKEKLKLRKEREMEYVRLNVNKIRRNNQLLVHKVHLLCLLARGFHLNNTLNSPILKAMALSFVPNEIIGKTSGKKVEKVNVSGLRSIMLWFCNSFTYTSKCDFFPNVLLNIVKSFQNETAVNVSYYNLMFLVIARVLGFKTRFCMSMYPISFKAQNLLPKSRKNVKRVFVKLENGNCQEIKTNVENEKEEKLKSKNSYCQGIKSNVEKEEKLMSNQRKSKKKSKNEQSKCIKKSPRTRKLNTKSYKISDDESDDTFKDEDFIASDLTDENSEPEENYDNSKISKKRKECFKISATNSIAKNKFSLKQRKRTNNLNAGSSDASDLESDVDDFVPVKSKRNNTRGKNSSSKKKQSEQKNSFKSNISLSEAWYKSDKVVCWTEIFSKMDKKWISIDCVNKLIGNSYEFEALAHKPISYVVAYDNDSYVKDVTSRYCSDFMIATRKLRVVSEWWKETLKPYCPPRSKMNVEEDDEMDMMLIHKPIPQTLTGLKDHPLYVLKRHLLKFEALYPPDTNPVGFLRGEPIYPRDCVAKLQSREKWFKNARVVRPGEEPYKMSTQPRWDKVNRVILKDVPLELFGFWQTDPYQPPVAKDGKIPRNEYGNVELFRPDMLPVGTVQIKIPGINRIAQKLDIDCSPAVSGFELTKGHIRPVFDGFIVCEEFKDTLMNAWEEEQKNVKRKQREKNEKRIYGNWKKLIKGLLIRERLKTKYHLN